MVEQWKHAASVGSAPPDPNAGATAIAPLPMSAVENKPAPGQKGPVGLSPRTTYSKVNTGMPPTPDAGAASQKSMAPRGMEFLPKVAFQEMHMTTSMKSPTLQDLVKVACEGAAAKVDISLESARQIANAGATPPTEAEKTAAAEDHIPTDYTDKLASALYFLAKETDPKLAAVNFPGTENNTGPGKGPNTLDVAAAKSEEPYIDAGQMGSATKQNQQPKDPALQKDPTRKPDPGTGLETNDSMMHAEQPVEPISNEKTTLTNESAKAASAEKTAEEKQAEATYANNLVHLGLAKVASAEDGSLYIEKTALLPAMIGGGAGAAQAPSGHRIRGAATGAAGTTAGGAAGTIGGGLLGGGAGGIAGAGLGALAGGALGGPGGALLGAAGGGVLGAGAGGVAGGLAGGAYGSKKGYDVAMGPLKELKAARAQNQQLQAQQPQQMPKAASAQPAPVDQSIYARNLMALGLYKQAEDAINPAKIAGGAAPAQGETPPPGAAPSEEGVPSEPSDVNKQKAMVDSNQAAIDYTKAKAKADPKSDMKDVLKEPALSAATDKTLGKVLDHTDGAKISHDLTRVAAARAVLSKLAETAGCASKKEKKSAMPTQGGSMPITPADASNFQASQPSTL